MSANAWKYVWMILAGGAVGLAEVFTDSKFPGWWDLVRHFAGGSISAIVGLNVTLVKKNGQ